MKRFIALLISAAVLLAACAVFCSAAQTDPYKLGDADGDGEVDIVDVTVVQRVVVKVMKDEDGSISRRADITGDSLDSVDATFIQRYTTHAFTPYPIGEYVYPEQPTEQPTQKPTQKPTQDEYELPFVPSK